MQEKLEELKRESNEVARRHEQALRRFTHAREEMKTLEQRAVVIEKTIEVMTR